MRQGSGKYVPTIVVLVATLYKDGRVENNTTGGARVVPGDAGQST